MKVDDEKLNDVFEGMGHTARKGFKAKWAFGEPIKVGDQLTIIPVARVMMAGGGGGGSETGLSGDEKDSGAETRGYGGGFGFKGGVKPLGYIKVKGGCAKFVRFHCWNRIGLLMLAAAVFMVMHSKKKELIMLELLKWKWLKHGMKRRRDRMRGNRHKLGPLHARSYARGMPHHKGGHGETAGRALPVLMAVKRRKAARAAVENAG